MKAQSKRKTFSRSIIGQNTTYIPNGANEISFLIK